MKTSELTGAALDWAVAKCEFGEETLGTRWGISAHYKGVVVPEFKAPDCYYYPSSNWALGGAIIERERIAIAWHMTHWVAWTGVIEHKGETPLIAAMRCYVSGKLGDEVDIPEELK